MLYCKENAPEGQRMKIDVITDESRTEPGIYIHCKKRDQRIEKIITAIYAADGNIALKQDGMVHMVGRDEILYFETVDRRVFAYTAQSVYEMQVRFKGMEDAMREFGFFRLSKTIVANLLHIKAIVPNLNRKFLISLSNHENIVLSITYSAHIFMLLE